jgi:hypothetical protein
MKRGVLLGAWVMGFGLVSLEQSSAQEDISALLKKATAYVDNYQTMFGSVVSEERYEQRIRRPLGATSTSSRNSGPTDTVLVSDFLLVQVPGEGWIPFRDVFERDGRKVRDREDRLASLFLKATDRTTFDQARTIMNEGARYNIGSIERNINAPTFTLPFLTPLHLYRFTFSAGGRDDSGTIIEFKETVRPTYIATAGGRDLPVTGRFWVDEATGTVRKTGLDAVDTTVEAHITVTYRPDDALGFWVPAQMDERYRGRSGSVVTTEVVGKATYSKFRRFQVTTSEDLAPPVQSAEDGR